VEAPIDGDLRDTLVEGKFGSFHVQAGTFIRAWEGTDGLNPMDIATMKNLRDPLNIEPLSSPGITLAGGEGFFTCEALYVPKQTPSRLPGTTSPFWPRTNNLPLEKDSVQLLMPDQPAYEFLSRETLTKAMDHNYGLRLQLHGQKWDFSVAGFEGAAQVPLLEPVISGDLVETDPKTVIQMNNPIQIRAIDYRRRTVSGLLVYTFDSWILRLASRHDQPMGVNDDLNDWSSGQTQKQLLPTWSDQSIVGLEHSTTIGDQTVILVAQYAYGVTPQSSGLLSVQDLFANAFLYGARWPLNDLTTVNFFGFYESTHHSTYNRLLLQRKISDPSLIEFSIDLLRGSTDSLLGILKDQSQAKLAYLFQF